MSTTAVFVGGIIRDLITYAPNFPQPGEQSDAFLVSLIEKMLFVLQVKPFSGKNSKWALEEKQLIR